MSLLGELLQTLHSSWTSWERLYVEYVMTSGSGSGVHRRRVWVDGRRSRVEEGGSELSAFAVRDGRRWWTYMPATGALAGEDTESSHNNAGEPPLALIRPAYLLGALRFEAVEEGERMGRRVLRAQAVRAADHRSPAAFALSDLGHRADECILDVDAERGVLLASHARAEGNVVQDVTALAVTFDEPFSDDVFVFDPPAGEEIRDWDTVFPQPRDVPLTVAAAEAPFTVFALDELPAGWTARVQWSAPRERPANPGRVNIAYRTDDGSHSVAISQSPDTGAPLDERHGTSPAWSTFEDGGVRGVVRGAGDGWRDSQLRAVRDGTLIAIYSSTYATDELIALARRLTPVAKTQPDATT